MDREPPAEAIEAMRAHRRDHHGDELEPRRDIDYPGHARADAPLTYEPTTAARGARYWCRECPGEVFVVSEPPYGDPERNALLRSTDPALRDSLGGVDPSQQDAHIEAWDRRQLGTAAKDAQRRKAMSTRKPHPGAERRRRAVQAYLLRRCVELGTAVAAKDDLFAMQFREPKRWREITGSADEVTASTIHGYWRQIDIAKRQAALAKAEETKRTIARAKPRN